MTDRRSAYVRGSGVLWRDSGSHVVVLRPRSGREPLVLGGGGVVIWRLLGEPRTLDDLVAKCRGIQPGSGPAEADVYELLTALADAQLIEEGQTREPTTQLV